MTILEAAVLLILLLLALPDACRKIKRPGLLYPLYILAGLVAGGFMTPEVRHVWREVGQFGFILLLFSVGLEVELPEKRESLTALRRAALWMLWQMPLWTALACLMGISWGEALVASVALAATSVGMAYHLWEKYRFADAFSRKQYLEWIVAVEVLAILFFTIAGPVLQGAVWWRASLKLIGVVVAVVGAAFLSSKGAPRLAALLSRGLNIQVHVLVLVLFALAAVGERLGLSAAKTAFVLGMFISRSTDEEAGLNARLGPVRDRMFVPVFFFGLGMLVEPRMILSLLFAVAVCASLVLFFMRRIVYGGFLAKRFRTDSGAHVIAAPVLTMAAVAVEVLSRTGASSEVMIWTIAAGLGLTLTAAFVPLDGGQQLSAMEPSLVAPEVWRQMETKKDPA